MNHVWSFPIEKLMKWRAGKWSTYDYDSKTIKWSIQVVYDLLVIAANSRVCESLNLHSKIKGIYKGDILILIISSSSQEIRKIKFQIKDNVVECLERLGQHFPILNHNSMAQDTVFKSRYRNIEEVMKNAVETIEKTGTIAVPTKLNDFVKLCLLDPKMPQIINETQKFIEGLNKS